MTTKPDERQRHNIRDILRHVADEVTLIYSPHRTVEATWLYAYARHAGRSVRLVPAATSRDIERATTAGTSLLVLADDEVVLPPGSMQLTGAPSASPLDLWSDPAALDAAEARFHRALPPTVRLRTGPDAVLTVASAVDANGVFQAVAGAINRGVRWDTGVTVTVESGRVVAIECGDATIEGLLRRAVHTHKVDRVLEVRFDVRAMACGLRERPDVTLRLGVEPRQAYSTASADLRIDVTATEMELT